MFGSHLSIAGGMVNALHRAKELRLDCVQVFTKNQRQWRVPPMDAADRDAWLTTRREMGWDGGANGARVVSHNSYLINLASPEKAVWEKSVALQRVEMERCAELEIPLLVAHPGAHLGDAPPARTPHDLRRRFTRDEYDGLRRIGKALNRLHRELPGLPVITCLETTAGSGTNLGFDFRHLAFLRDFVTEPERIGFCFDTCHALAAGYDLTSEDGTNGVLDEWDEVCGLSNLRVFHLNDSKGARGTRLDRHAHVGYGACGLGCFRAVVNRAETRGVPKILETPKETDEKGEDWDRRNVRRLKRLARPPSRSR